MFLLEQINEFHSFLSTLGECELRDTGDSYLLFFPATVQWVTVIKDGPIAIPKFSDKSFESLVGSAWRQYCGADDEQRAGVLRQDQREGGETAESSDFAEGSSTPDWQEGCGQGI